MSPSQLSNVNKTTRKMIEKYIKDKNISLNAFAKGAGVHQNQLWLYLHSGDVKKGLHSSTLEKIGKFLKKNK
jgi:hypothetical protein